LRRQDSATARRTEQSRPPGRSELFGFASGRAAEAASARACTGAGAITCGVRVGGVVTGASGRRPPNRERHPPVVQKTT
ncbi:hypothetical protein, partial [Aeromicrobium sp.]|uniref:hypothetical protein n=1 Tax=Aeromicrobium sp. TaxID=1871063 RepID=UPI0025BB9D09